MDTLNSIYLTDRTQISMQNIRMQGVIGRGAFGLVRKAIIKVGDREQLVAVKMLRSKTHDGPTVSPPSHLSSLAECPNADDIKEFRHEIDVMKAVGKHPNIVSLIGHSTNQPDMMILIGKGTNEYCSIELCVLIQFINSNSNCYKKNIAVEGICCTYSGNLAVYNLV